MKVKKFDSKKMAQARMPQSLKELNCTYGLMRISPKDVRQGRLVRALRRIPEKVTFISEGVLCGLAEEKQPTVVMLPKNIKYIGENAFANSSISEFYMTKTGDKNGVASGVEELGEDCFANSKLRRIVFSSKLKRIPVNTCANCTELTEAEIPNSVEVIGHGAFEGCKNLKRVVFGKNVRQISPNAFKGTGLEEVFLPDSVESILDGAFQDCPNLRNVKLSGRLEKIYANAFKGSDISSITIPKSVKLLNLQAFSDCKNLKTIKFEGFNPKISIYGGGNYNFDDETLLMLLMHAPGFIKCIPQEKLRNEEFVAQCRQAIATGMDKRDKCFGLTKERLHGDIKTFNNVNEYISKVTGKGLSDLQESKQSAIENFKKGGVSPVFDTINK